MAIHLPPPQPEGPLRTRVVRLGGLLGIADRYDPAAWHADRGPAPDRGLAPDRGPAPDRRRRAVFRTEPHAPGGSDRAGHGTAAA